MGRPPKPLITTASRAASQPAPARKMSACFYKLPVWHVSNPASHQEQAKQQQQQQQQQAPKPPQPQQQDQPLRQSFKSTEEAASNSVAIVRSMDNLLEAPPLVPRSPSNVQHAATTSNQARSIDRSASKAGWGKLKGFSLSAIRATDTGERARSESKPILLGRTATMPAALVINRTTDVIV